MLIKNLQRNINKEVANVKTIKKWTLILKSTNSLATEPPARAVFLCIVYKFFQWLKWWIERSLSQLMSQKGEEDTLGVAWFCDADQGS